MCRRSGKLSDKEAFVVAIIDFRDRRARENACAKGSFGVDYLTIVCGESGQRRRRRVWDAICYQVSLEARLKPPQICLGYFSKPIKSMRVFKRKLKFKLRFRALVLRRVTRRGNRVLRTSIQLPTSVLRHTAVQTRPESLVEHSRRCGFFVRGSTNKTSSARLRSKREEPEDYAGRDHLDSAPFPVWLRTQRELAAYLYSRDTLSRWDWRFQCTCRGSTHDICRSRMVSYYCEHYNHSTCYHYKQWLELQKTRGVDDTP
ncbi:hypothetical protein ARMGADRAFT_175324 [Armillaria gallica]|uniref:Uncharacterized protein n=1 Tax=Armillaria gallica TaxID=47427 RepID=A0A2H3CLG8_ARMGA|nr:hypothetical protein ARMGADRAFT_175324 [Armillaria gallica]